MRNLKQQPDKRISKQAPNNPISNQQFKQVDFGSLNNIRQAARSMTAAASEAKLKGIIQAFLADQSPSPNVILEIGSSLVTGAPYTNPQVIINGAQIDTTSQTWTRDLVGGQTFPENDPPKWEWTPILHSDDEFDDSVGVSGVAVSPDISGGDIPFTHPFVTAGKLFGTDYEFYIAPDPQYIHPGNSLLAVTNGGRGGSDGINKEYTDAYNAAKDLQLAIPGVLGVETDSAFVPPQFQAQSKDRVVVFGRWIVDDGHDDFHTEIHSPLLLAAARLTSDTETYSTLIGRPYLVSQQFNDGALRQHLINELLKVAAPGIISMILELAGFGLFPNIIPGSLHLEAHPNLLNPPFKGVRLLSYVVRPPFPRIGPLDKLIVEFHFTVRPGVTIQVYDAGNDTVGIAVLLSESDYLPAPLPSSQSVNATLDDLDALHPGLKKLIYESFVVSAGASAVLAGATGAADLPDLIAIMQLIASRGILTDQYELPQPVISTESDVTTVELANVANEQPHFSVDPGQPFPFYGFLKARWDPTFRVAVPVNLTINDIKDHVPGTQDELGALLTFVKVKMGDDSYLNPLDSAGRLFKRDFFKAVQQINIQIELWRGIKRTTIQAQMQEINGKYYAVVGSTKIPLPDDFENLPPIVQSQLLTFSYSPPINPGMVSVVNVVYDFITQQVTGDVTGSAGQQLHALSGQDPQSNVPTPDLWFTIT